MNTANERRHPLTLALTNRLRSNRLSPFELAHTPPRGERAFTRLELTAILAASTLLLMLAYPMLASTKPRYERVACVNNLRQIGKAFRVWANEHEDRNPFWVPVAQGGVSRGPGGAPPHPLINNAWLHFYWISNELASPRVLACPSDSARRVVASDFSHLATGLRRLGDSAVSYVIFLHALSDSPYSWLGGDRNLRHSGPSGGCSTGANASLSLRPQFLQDGWTNAIHGVTGNLLLNHGGVLQSSNEDLRRSVVPQANIRGTHHFLPPR